MTQMMSSRSTLLLLCLVAFISSKNFYIYLCKYFLFYESHWTKVKKFLAIFGSESLQQCMYFLSLATRARWMYSQSDYISNAEEQRVREMAELADEVEQARHATCARMESLDQNIVEKMERLNCPRVQQGKQLV